MRINKSLGLMVCLMLPLLITGCLSSDVRKMAEVDYFDKSITVPPGGSGLLGPLKDSLNKSGWTVKVLAGPEMTTGRVGANTSLSTYDTFNTRYVLRLRQTRVDTCIIGGDALNYDLSIIDTKSGGELLTMNGRDCADGIVSKFDKAIAR